MNPPILFVNLGPYPLALLTFLGQIDSHDVELFLEVKTVGTSFASGPLKIKWWVVEPTELDASLLYVPINEVICERQQRMELCKSLVMEYCTSLDTSSEASLVGSHPGHGNCFVMVFSPTLGYIFFKFITALI